MMHLLIKQSAREAKMQLKNYWGELLAVCLCLAIFFSMAVAPLLQSDFAFSKHMLWISCALCALELFSILFQKSLVFIIHPAAMQYCFNTGYMGKVKRLYFCKKCLTKLLLAVLVGLVLCDFAISLSLFAAIVALFLYFVICSLLRWMKYNDYARHIVFALFLAGSLLFVLAMTYSANLFYIPTALLGAVFAVVLFLQNKMAVNWAKYYDDISYVARIGHAGRHKLMVEMAQIADEHVANRERTIKLYHFPLNRKNALFFKALLESMRMGKQVTILLGLFLAFAVVLNRTSLFAQIPLIGEPSIAPVVGALAVAAFAANLREIYSNQILTVRGKHAAGQFLPYEFHKIVLSYGAVCCCVLTLVMALMCIVLNAAVLVGLGVVALYNLVMLLSFLLLYKGKGIKAISLVSAAVLTVCAYFLF